MDCWAYYEHHSTRISLQVWSCSHCWNRRRFVWVLIFLRKIIYELIGIKAARLYYYLIDTFGRSKTLSYLKTVIAELSNIFYGMFMYRLDCSIRRVWDFSRLGCCPYRIRRTGRWCNRVGSNQRRRWRTQDIPSLWRSSQRVGEWWERRAEG